jgi:hypothetical protein
MEEFGDEENSATPAGVGFLGMNSGGGDRFAVLPPARAFLNMMHIFRGSPDNLLSGFAPVGSGANKKQPGKMA